MAKTKKTFSVYADIKGSLSVDISANDFDEALATAKTLRVPDFVDAKSDDGWMDFEDVTITGIYSE
jgi:hypothetical protein